MLDFSFRGPFCLFYTYVAGNNGLVGMVFPNSTKEVVLKLREGDIIPVPLGSLSWWYNGEGDSDLVIVYLGKTAKAHIPGEFTYLLQAGGIGILAGFSNDFVRRAYGLSEEEADKLANSQKGVMIIAVSPEKTLNLKPQMSSSDNDTCAKNKLVYNIDEAYPDYKAKKGGGFWTMVSQTKFPFIGEVGLSANHIELGPGSISSPIYTTDSSAQLIYFVKGHGRIQIVGILGKRVLDSEVKAGHLVIVPRFFVVAVMAGEEGLECLSVITSSE